LVLRPVLSTVPDWAMAASARGKGGRADDVLSDHSPKAPIGWVLGLSLGIHAIIQKQNGENPRCVDGTDFV
jgi:hypothetical protein